MQSSPGYVLALVLGMVSSQAAAVEVLPTITAQESVMPLEYQVDGVVEARRQATLSSEVAGKIEAVFFDVDDNVKKGDVILKIRDREYRAQLEKARATLKEARANLQEMRLAHERNDGLRKQKLISQAVFDKSSASLKAAQARASSAQASLVQAEEQLGYTVVRAPYSGVVVERHVEVGESTRPGQPFMTGYAPGELRVSANVPQSIVARLRTKRMVRVVLLEDGRSLEVERITAIEGYSLPGNAGQGSCHHRRKQAPAGAATRAGFALRGQRCVPAGQRRQARLQTGTTRQFIR